MIISGNEEAIKSHILFPYTLCHGNAGGARQPPVNDQLKLDLWENSHSPVSLRYVGTNGDNGFRASEAMGGHSVTCAA